MNDFFVRAVLSALVTCGLAACGGKRIDLGSDDSSLEADEAESELETETCTALEDLRRSERAEDLRQLRPVIPTGTWQGTIDEHSFPSGSSAVSVTLGEDGAGTVLFGDGQGPFEPPDDAATLSTWLLPLQEGFAYALYAMELEGDVVRFRFYPHEMYATLCSAQSAYEVASCEYRCLPNEGYSFVDLETNECARYPEGDTPVPVDCKTLFLCEQRRGCDCLSTGCTFSTSAVYEFNGTLNAEARSLSGSFHDMNGTVTLSWVAEP